MNFGVFRSKYGSTTISGILSFWIRLMISSVWVGEGGMPGFGSTCPTMLRPKRRGKLGHEAWEVTILAPAYGALLSVHSFSFSVSFASEGARVAAEHSRPRGSSPVRFAAECRA